MLKLKGYRFWPKRSKGNEHISLVLYDHQPKELTDLAMQFGSDRFRCGRCTIQLMHTKKHNQTCLEFEICVQAGERAARFRELSLIVRLVDLETGDTIIVDKLEPMERQPSPNEITNTTSKTLKGNASLSHKPDLGIEASRSNSVSFQTNLVDANEFQSFA